MLLCADISRISRHREGNNSAPYIFDHMLTKDVSRTTSSKRLPANRCRARQSSLRRRVNECAWHASGSRLAPKMCIVVCVFSARMVLPFREGVEPAVYSRNSSAICVWKSLAYVCTICFRIVREWNVFKLSLTNIALRVCVCVCGC